MTAYTFALGCPRPSCAGDLAHITDALPLPHQSSAVVKCVACNWEFQVLVRLLPMPMPRSLERRVQRERAMA